MTLLYTGCANTQTSTTGCVFDKYGYINIAGLQPGDVLIAVNQATAFGKWEKISDEHYGIDTFSRSTFVFQTPEKTEFQIDSVWRKESGMFILVSADETTRSSVTSAIWSQLMDSGAIKRIMKK